MPPEHRFVRRALAVFAAFGAVLAVGRTIPALAAPPAPPSEELLPADDAFRTSARLLSPGRIEVRYDTAPGYYLYRDRLSYVVDPSTARLGKPKLPPGKVKKDEFFGRQVVYRHKSVVTLPVSWDGKGPLTLTADLQGCADLGVCYPPVRRTFKLTAPEPAAK